MKSCHNLLNYSRKEKLVFNSNQDKSVNSADITDSGSDLTLPIPTPDNESEGYVFLIF